MRILRAIVLVCSAALLGVPLARAGGDFVDLAAGDGRIWFAGPPGVRSFEASTGQPLSAPSPTGAAYPLSVTVAGGAAWVASVENGYLSGTLTRIDERTGKTRVVWRTDAGSVQSVAAGAGGVWALLGSRSGSRIALFALSGRLVHVWQVAHAGWIAADGAGCWVSTGSELLQIAPGGTVRRVVQAASDGVVTGGGAVWLPRATSVLRYDGRSGKMRTLATGRLMLGGFQHDLAVGDGALWALGTESRTRSTLARFDPESGRLTGSAPLPGIGDALVVEPGAIWAATVLAPPGHSATGYDLIRLDPQTLRRTLLVHVV